MSATGESRGCPAWCLGNHREEVEHHSARVRVGDLVAELIRYPNNPQVYLSLLEPDAGGRYLLVPMSVVPLIATVAQRLSA